MDILDLRHNRLVVLQSQEYQIVVHAAEQMNGCSCGHPECHGGHSLYIVTDKVWNQAARALQNDEVTTSRRGFGIMSGGGHLHPKCLERIIGRELTRDDCHQKDTLNLEKDLVRKI